MTSPSSLYLASRSPRRRELLAQLGVAHTVLAVTVDESRHPEEPPPEFVVRVARAKADAGRRALGASADRPVLGADTAVVLGDRVFGKPRDDDDAVAMLADLSGRTHEVLTGVAVASATGIASRLSRSRVWFRPTTERERRAYAATGEPRDKAGAYAIQGLAAVFVERLEGSYSGVMGLPVFETAALLQEAGIDVMPRAPAT